MYNTIKALETSPFIFQFSHAHTCFWL